MSGPRAHPVWLTAAQRHRLKKVARGHKSPYRDRLRAQVVLDAAAGHANAAARDLRGAARHAAFAAAQAAAVAHVAAHELGAAAYAIKAAQAAAPDDERRAEAGREECRWQRDRLPDEIRDLVLDDQRLRNELCWYVFDS